MLCERVVGLASLDRLSILVVASDLGRRLLVEDGSGNECCSILVEGLLLLVDEIVEIDLVAAYI